MVHTISLPGACSAGVPNPSGGRWFGFILFKFDSSKPLFRVLGEPWLSNLTTSVRRRHVPEGGVQGRKTPYIRIVQILKPS